MCFILIFETKEEAIKASKSPSIARKDIIVYKSVIRNAKNSKNSFSSYFEGFQYDRGYEYEEDSFGIQVYEEISYNSRNSKLMINRGLHSYSKKPVKRSSYVVIKCVIPKGAKYWYSKKDGVYVSNRLIIL